jgi:hypothetical protein
VLLTCRYKLVESGAHKPAPVELYDPAEHAVQEEPPAKGMVERAISGEAVRA